MVFDEYETKQERFKYQLKILQLNHNSFSLQDIENNSKTSETVTNTTDENNCKNTCNSQDIINLDGEYVIIPKKVYESLNNIIENNKKTLKTIVKLINSLLKE